MTKHRKRSNWFYTSAIVRQIATHPGNRGARLRAFVRACSWQLRKRMSEQPRDVAIFGGMRLRCYPDSTSASNVHYFGDYYEFHEMSFVAKYLRPGDGFIDGGANIGTYTLLAAQRIGRTGVVDAFEPAPESARRLTENAALNDLTFVRIHEAALGAVRGQVSFSLDWDVSNRLVGLRRLEGRTMQVEMVRLDDALEGDRWYAMGKLDLEGAEVDALLGAEGHLAEGNPPVWQLEVLDGQLAAQGKCRTDLFTLLDHYGYSATLVTTPGHISFVDWPASGSGMNILAVKRDALELVSTRIGSVTG